MAFVVASFYHFFDFPDYAAKRAALLDVLKKNDIKGSILIAAEGINGTISGNRKAIDNALLYIKSDITGGEFEHKESLNAHQPFGKAKVRLKKELISLGEAVPVCHPRLERGSQATGNASASGARPPLKAGDCGTYVEPKDWNALIADPDTVVLDTRNAYETHLGTFEGALDPDIKTFKELPAYVKKNMADAQRQNIATFCTGGIRCEKFTAWLKGEGYENVYHLKGGILKYLEEIPESESKWKGECYVFDERVAVGHGLTPSPTATMCPGCGHALTPQDREHSLYIEGECCGFCRKD